MDEIERIDTREPAHGHAKGRFVYYLDHLADKKAALAAQAEEHAGDRLVELAELTHKHSNELAESFRKGYATKEAEARGEGEPALIHYQDDAALIGEPCMIHKDFMPAMHRIVTHAHNCDVQLYITHSFRPLNAKLVGAIVEQAARSNHHAGSGVDMNPVYDGVWYTSEMMADFENLPDPVKGFLVGVDDDRNLRWGGGFNVNKDRVHVDDDLVRRDPAEWLKRVGELQDAL